MVQQVLERKMSEEKERNIEKRVSFEGDSSKRAASKKEDMKIRSESLPTKSKLPIREIRSHSAEEKRTLTIKSEDSSSEDNKMTEDNSVPSSEDCDVEALSGTIFRKVTVRRRRQEMKKVSAIDNGKFLFLYFVYNYLLLLIAYK